jgi:zinc and cadmium transporter
VSAVLNTGLAVVGVSALSLLGLLSLGIDERRMRTWVPVLTSLAAGALAGGALFELIPEAIARQTGRAAIVVGVVAGFIGFWFLEQGLHHAAKRRSNRHSRAPFDPIVALNFIGDVLHNAVDGSIIAAAFLTTPTVGVVATLAIVLHEIPRELGSFGVFMHGGLSVRRAVWYNGLTGVAALASAALTLRIGARTADAATALLPVAAGTFLYIAVSVAPSAILAAPSSLHRVRRLALAAAALAATAFAARFG